MNPRHYCLPSRPADGAHSQDRAPGAHYSVWTHVRRSYRTLVGDGDGLKRHLRLLMFSWRAVQNKVQEGSFSWREFRSRMLKLGEGLTLVDLFVS